MVVIHFRLLSLQTEFTFEKKKKKSAEPQRGILSLAALRMDRLCNFHATSEALSALCGFVYECVCVCVCDYVVPRLVSSSSFPSQPSYSGSFIWFLRAELRGQNWSHNGSFSFLLPSPSYILVFVSVCQQVVDSVCKRL